MEPYKEYKFCERCSIREFYVNTNTSELIWHRDKEDRLITPLCENDWKFQMDNELPIYINKSIFIPKETFHRIIKGTSSSILIYLIKNKL